MNHGDKNTKFFHSKASQRQRRNFIQGIKDQQNVWVEEIDDIVAVATDYFKEIFISSTCDQMEECLNSVSHKVTPNMLEACSSDYSVEEIKATLFQTGPTKAPRPDGMNAQFYKNFWHIVGDDVINVILNFLNYGNMVPLFSHCSYP